MYWHHVAGCSECKATQHFRSMDERVWLSFGSKSPLPCVVVSVQQDNLPGQKARSNIVGRTSMIFLGECATLGEVILLTKFVATARLQAIKLAQAACAIPSILLILYLRHRLLRGGAWYRVNK